METLLATLPSPFRHRSKHIAQFSEQRSTCPTVPGDVQMHTGEEASGIIVGSHWSTPGGGSDLKKSSLSDVLQGLAESLDTGARAWLGLRELVGLEGWLQAVELRLPLQLHSVVELLKELRQFIQTERQQVFWRGGSHVVCSSAWKDRTAFLREAIAVATSETSSTCLHASCRAWALLHSLAAANTTGTDATGLDLLESLWALL